MAKKITNPDKLKTEIALQKSKMQSLQLLDKELEAKLKRLEHQRQSIKEKYNKLYHASQQNIQRLSNLGGN